MMLSSITKDPRRKRNHPSSTYDPVAAAPSADATTSLPTTAEGESPCKRPKISQQALPGESHPGSFSSEHISNDAVDPLTHMIEANNGRHWRDCMPDEFRQFTKDFIEQYIASDPFLRVQQPCSDQIEDFHFIRSESQSMYLDQELIKKICVAYSIEF